MKCSKRNHGMIDIITLTLNHHLLNLPLLNLHIHNLQLLNQLQLNLHILNLRQLNPRLLKYHFLQLHKTLIFSLKETFSVVKLFLPPMY